MIKYAFRDDGGPVILKNFDKANPQVIGETLAKIAATNEGRLSAPAVVKAASSKSSPLHPHFEWNDKIAANHFRVDQARSLIRLIRELPADGKEPRPAYISIADQGTAYRSSEEVVTSLELQLIVLKQAERDLQAWERRYSMLREICELVTAAREKIAEVRKDVERKTSKRKGGGDDARVSA